MFIPFYAEQGQILAATRRFERGSERYFLVLDPQRFEQKPMTAARVLSSRPAADRAWRESAFSRALDRQASPPHPLQNDGLRAAEYPVKGFFVTADLCPGKRPLDRRFFTATASLPQKPPLPIALMVSGLWMKHHQADLAWLKDQVAAGRLAVTWVNHSFTHAHDPIAPLDKNFLLIPETDFPGEVLLLERLLLEQDLTPSPFFRFPGLVSNQRLIEGLRELHLIPIGTNAWMAKGDTPRAGSVILIHANGNEPEGVHRLLAFYDGQRGAFLRGDSALLPLREAFLPR